ncbi:hypothetical protein BCV69DRAFT_314381 [Microstroma glucosiphilum]|uniref:Cytochrome c oxidase-assembly factor COX23, mitochondrial n=1 Tax=Pseudomicrostroma glucosiphilum TaxID=1684307 RepID=A0A316U0T9_9BASI|nr:hypothetical protein BCV69DRAFT_314381 [Pseudomicrostroma glucosiphilum]PWN18820.1 hypothetical protein BCV69DRAFT_314381 [Pseudomicrostroma glucosiphilum]
MGLFSSSSEPPPAPVTSSPPPRSQQQQQDEQDNSKPKDWISVMPGKAPSKFSDPCAHAAKASMKCMENNSYDRGKCTEAFEEYRECKKRWVLQRRHDRAAGRQGAWD